MDIISFSNLSLLRKIKYLVIGIFILLNLIVLAVSLRMDGNDLRFLIRMVHYIPHLRYFVISNIFLFLIILIINHRELRKVQRHSARKDKEILELESRLQNLFDKEDMNQLNDKKNKKKASNGF